MDKFGNGDRAGTLLMLGTSFLKADLEMLDAKHQYRWRWRAGLCQSVDIAKAHGFYSRN
jgi:hypothetical protein